MSLDWYPGIRECCAHWSDAAMLQQTFQALDKEFMSDNDACIDCAKSIVEVVCRVIVDELENQTAPVRPVEANPNFGAWVSAAVKALKLGDTRNNAFNKLVSQHHKLTATLGDLRNDAGPVSHGKDAFVARLSAYHRRAAVLSADAIVAFLHTAYLEAELNLARTREPYERFGKFHASVDRYASLRLENDEDNSYFLIVTIAGGEDITVPVSASEILFHLDRTAYVEALKAGQDADEHILDGFGPVDMPEFQGQTS
jgi:hypothetical protein